MMAENHIQNATKIATDLRRLADETESQETQNLTFISVGHYAPAYVESGVVVESYFLGWTIVISTMQLPPHTANHIERMIRGESVPYEVTIPSLSLQQRQQAIEAIKNSKTMQIPRPAPPELTLCGRAIDVIPSGSICVVRCTANEVALKAKMFSAAIELREQRPNLTFVILPDQMDIKAISLDQLKQLRDRVNEVIYDKENGKTGTEASR
jgi:hypothetical protein